MSATIPVGNYQLALAAGVKIEDITNDKRNAEVIRRIRANDPKFTSLRLRSKLRLRTEEDSDEEDGRSVRKNDYFPTSAYDAGWLGYFIGKSKCITNLEVVGDVGSNHDHEIMGPFFGAFRKNKCVESLELWGIRGRQTLQGIGTFFSSCRHLVSFDASHCNFGAEGCRLLSLAFAGCPSKFLRDVSLCNCNIRDDQFPGIAIGLSLHPNLKRLVFTGNQIGLKGCVALSTLLQWTATKVRTLKLNHNAIDDDAVEVLAAALSTSTLEELNLRWNYGVSAKGWRSIATLLTNPHSRLKDLAVPGDEDAEVGDEAAVTFANALASNHSLQRLRLNDHTITSSGWKALSKLLCDMSSVNNTFLSNHTLDTVESARPALGHAGHAGWYDVFGYLAMNSRGWDRKDVAIRKILRHHLDFDMKPFLEWEFKALPLLIKWFDRAATCTFLGAYEKETNLPRRRLDAIFQFARGLPELLVESHLRLELGELKEEQMKLQQRLEEVQERKRTVLRKLGEGI